MADQQFVFDRDFFPELNFYASKSSGAGGQHVNKVNTKVELRFDIPASQLLSEEEKQVLMTKMQNKINSEGVLIITSQSSRSQHKNKKSTIEKFYDLLEKAFTPEKKRKKTKPSRAAKEKRLKNKKAHSEKKALRQKPIRTHE